MIWPDDSTYVLACSCTAVVSVIGIEAEPGVSEDVSGALILSSLKYSKSSVDVGHSVSDKCL